MDQQSTTEAADVFGNISELESGEVSRYSTAGPSSFYWTVMDLVPNFLQLPRRMADVPLPIHSAQPGYICIITA